MKTTLSSNFLLFWFGQLFSSFSSSMTSFAISIWVYSSSGSVLSLSISSVAIMLPRMIGGVLAAPLIDRLNKKTILLVTDIGAGLCTLLLFLLINGDNLEIWHIYLINILTSLFGGIQRSTSEVIVSTIVDDPHYVKASGMKSLSSAISDMFAPILAASFLAIIGMDGIIIFDLLSMTFACWTLYLWVKIPAIQDGDKTVEYSLKHYFQELIEGFHLMSKSSVLCTLLIFMSLINLFAGMTYFNLLTPMILARTQFDEGALAITNFFMGLGGVIGGIVVSFMPEYKSKAKVVFLCSVLSFLFGDVLLGLGNNVYIYSIALFSSGLFLPALNANESYLWRKTIPIEFQGRVFSFKYALQSGMIPIGVLIGGILADYVFEPFMLESNNIFSSFVGNGPGSGMALMFILAGVLGSITSIIGLIQVKSSGE